ncbi:MAG: hypothetical protein JST33_06760 [Actinobacteria bacterium]|nr:hypothetical protein [Actinomycetota bacterium]
MIALSLIACTPGTSSSHSSPSPRKSPNATTIAKNALKDYTDTTTAVQADAGEHPDRFVAVATGTQLQQLQTAASTWRNLHIAWKGTLIETVERATFADDGIAMTYCSDSTHFAPYNLNGGDVDFTPGRNRFNAVLVSISGSWLMSTRSAAGAC